MKTKKLLLALLLACVPVFSTCSGSGGGGPPSVDNPPSLVSVSFVGSSTNPVAGDKLRLLMSEAVTLSANTFDDADLVISGGGSLGTLTAAPVVLNSIIVEITLGAGVSLTGGSTTLDFVAANDVVRDAAGASATASTARTLTKADLDLPVIDDLTVAAVDSTLNGTANSGTLQAATTGFTINVQFTDASAIAAASTVISSSLAVLVNGANVVAGENLTANLTAASGTGTLTFTVPASVSFPTGSHTLTVRVVDVTGQLSLPKTFTFLTKTMSASNRPFENGQTWFLDTSRDLESYTFTPSTSSIPAQVAVVDGSNGRTDLEDLLRILGLQSSSPLANVDGTKDSNVVVLDLLEARILSTLASFFPGVNINFTFTSPGTFPNTTTVGYASFGFSQICIAGAHVTGGTDGVLGLAIFDSQNNFQVNNCETNFLGTRLGVFLHTLVTNGEQEPQSNSPFRDTYDTFTSARSGSPIGAAGDATHLVMMINSGNSNDPRYLAIKKAIEDLARFTALVIAHECGHSMGLVQNGAMPTGLYGGDATNFPGSANGHIVMPSDVFTGNSLNIMTPSISYIGGLDPTSRFNSLNLAYLREQVVHN